MGYISVGVAAKRLGVTPGRIRHRIYAGELEARQIRGRWYLEESSIPNVVAPRYEPEKLSMLDARDQEVAAMLTAGATQADIARRLGLSRQRIGMIKDRIDRAVSESDTPTGD